MLLLTYLIVIYIEQWYWMSSKHTPSFEWFHVQQWFLVVAATISMGSMSTNVNVQLDGDTSAHFFLYGKKN